MFLLVFGIIFFLSLNSAQPFIASECNKQKYLCHKFNCITFHIQYLRLFPFQWKEFYEFSPSLDALGYQPKSGFLIICLLNQRSIEMDDPMRNFRSFKTTKEGRPDARTTWDVQSLKATRPRIWPIETLHYTLLHPFTPKFFNTQYSGLYSRLPRPKYTH